MADQAAEQWGAAAIINACEHVISSFNAAAHSLDTHLEAALQALRVAPGSEAACFIGQVVYGTYRWVPQGWPRPHQQCAAPAVQRPRTAA